MSIEKWADRWHGVLVTDLYGHPFGFTREDVEHVRAAANAYIDGGMLEPGKNPILAEYLRELADRIEVLLPPDEDVG